MKTKTIFPITLTLCLAIFSQLSHAGESHARESHACEKKEHAKTKLAPPKFEDIDTNNNGEITLDEFKKHKIPHKDHQTIFAHIDNDGDGIITKEELISHKPPRRNK